MVWFHRVDESYLHYSTSHPFPKVSCRDFRRLMTLGARTLDPRWLLLNRRHQKSNPELSVCGSNTPQPLDSPAHMTALWSPLPPTSTCSTPRFHRSAGISWGDFESLDNGETSSTKMATQMGVPASRKKPWSFHYLASPHRPLVVLCRELPTPHRLINTGHPAALS